MERVSICIASHNMAHLLPDAINSCLRQDYENIEIVILDDASSDGTGSLTCLNSHKIKYYHSNEPSGTGGAFNKAIDYATGDFIVLLCADDVFTDHRVIADIVNVFRNNPSVAHVSRYYYQFVHGDDSPVRAWRMNNIIELANNPSGLAFRAKTLYRYHGNVPEKLQLTNKMFVEVANLVYEIMKDKSNYAYILTWDTVAVRIHQSISRDRKYYLKRWNSSPIEEWVKLGGKSLLNDFTSLIQIKNYFVTSAVIKEGFNFIRLRPANIIRPSFWFFFLISVFVPRCILKRIPEIYRKYIGSRIVKKINRHE